jgi:hypothetical protein
VRLSPEVAAIFGADKERPYPDRRLPHTVRQRKLRGGYSELVACTWLLENGYEVFRNVADRGYADLVAYRGGKVIMIDVKTVRVTRLATGEYGCLGGQALKPHQVRLGIVPLYVTDEGICGWQTAAIRDRLNGEPEAL